MPDPAAANPLPGWPRGLSAPLAAAYIGVSEMTLRRQVEAGELAKPVSVSPKRLVWLKEDLDAFLDRKAGRTIASAEDAPWSN